GRIVCCLFAVGNRADDSPSLLLDRHPGDNAMVRGIRSIPRRHCCRTIIAVGGTPNGYHADAARIVSPVVAFRVPRLPLIAVV
ncbi:MAG: hypothetical protein J2P48_22310, partial [Alphaproteobacteria bacterium]|nr:hypothetical protein [Alphaproteobacteria bacterium]